MSPFITPDNVNLALDTFVVIWTNRLFFTLYNTVLEVCGEYTREEQISKALEWRTL